MIPLYPAGIMDNVKERKETTAGKKEKTSNIARKDDI